MSAPIRITVRCFSHVKDVLRREELTLDLPRGATAGDVVAQVRGMGGGLLVDLPVRVAVNKTIVAETAPLRHGDEVALIPPVQGG